MASLGLKAVLYGVDKFPDKWFEKVPGGYYKEKEMKYKDDKKKKRRSDKNKERSRRNASRSPSPNGYRSDGEGYRKSRNRNEQYDDDDADYQDQRGGQGRARSLGGARGRVSATSLDGADNNGAHANTRGYNPAEYPRTTAYEREDYYNSRPLERGGSGDGYVPAGVAAGAAAGAATAASHYQEQSRPMSSGPAGGYVPYADIYAPQPRQAYQTNLNDAQSNYSVPYGQHNGRSTAQGYQQTPYDQAYSYGGQPQAMYADTGRRRDNRGGSSSSPSHSSEDEHRRRRHRKRSSRSTGRDRSRQRDSSRSRPQNGVEQRPRAKSSIRDRFDITERGLGYGAIGATAGGLVGSELGKGILPTLAGAVIGGLGANAFESREKQKKEARRNSVRYGASDSPHGSKRSSRAYDGKFPDW